MSNWMLPEDKKQKQGTSLTWLGTVVATALGLFLLYAIVLAAVALTKWVL